MEWSQGLVLPNQCLEINSAGVNIHEHKLRSSAGEIQMSLGRVSPGLSPSKWDLLLEDGTGRTGWWSGESGVQVGVTGRGSKGVSGSLACDDVL